MLLEAAISFIFKQLFTMKKVFTALCLFFCYNSLSQSIYYVNDEASGANNGSSWINAFTKLQDALAKAGSRDQIWVAEGTYYPDEGKGLTNNDRVQSFHLKNGVGIYGGFAGTETKLSDRNWNTHVTTLSGDIDHAAGNSGNAYHVLVNIDVNETAILDGFTITGGNADGSDQYYFGGGAFNQSSSPTIANCIFSENNANEAGGMYNIESSAPTIKNCRFSENTAAVVAGAIYNYTSSPNISYCVFSNNRAFGAGGILNYVGSNPIISNCSFSGNVAFGTNGGNSGAGGLYNQLSSSPTIINCSFTGNRSNWIAGGLYNANSSAPTIINCSFSNNWAAEGGGGMYNLYDAAPTLINCSFSGNATPLGAGGIHTNQASVKLINCILWGNDIEIINEQSNSVVVTHSIIKGGYAGTGNLDKDPLFVDAAHGDLHLKAGSPAIDKGLNSANTTSVDLDGKPRVVNGVIDMGAYEYQAAPLVITSVTANPSVLWPPNHKMKEVQVTVISSGGSGSTQCRITKVSSNEPQSGKGKKGLAPDWQIISADKVLLRAERNGNGEGRIYTITVTCTDASGSSASKTVQVKVPHDQGNKVDASITEREDYLNEETGGRLRAVPNPFYGQTTVHFSVPQSGFTTLDVVDATGAVVKHLYAAQAEKGRIYTQTLGSQQLKGGVYILRLAMDKYVQTYRLVLVQ